MVCIDALCWVKIWIGYGWKLTVPCIQPSIRSRKWYPSCRKKSTARFCTSIFMVIPWSKECSCEYFVLPSFDKLLSVVLIAVWGMVWTMWAQAKHRSQISLNPHELRPTSRCRPFCHAYCQHSGWITACIEWISKRREPEGLWCIVVWKFRACHCPTPFVHCLILLRYSYTLEASFAGFDSSRQGTCFLNLVIQEISPEAN